MLLDIFTEASFLFHTSQPKMTKWHNRLKCWISHYLQFLAQAWSSQRYKCEYRFMCACSVRSAAQRPWAQVETPTSFSTCNCCLVWVGRGVLWRQPLPVAVSCLWCHFHVLWGKKKFTEAPPMPTSAIKHSTDSVGHKVIFFLLEGLSLCWHCLCLISCFLP